MPAPSSPSDPLDPIDQELADHLATAEEALRREGLDPAEARRQAEQRFGDLAAIRRRCNWVIRGDQIMMRVLVLIVVVGLICGLIAMSVATWQAQSQMARQMQALGEQLSRLAESGRPAAPSLPEAETALELTGRVYEGRLDRPRPDHELTLIQLKDGTVVRRTRSDAQGRYRLGPLGEGDYALLTREAQGGIWRYEYLQSQPLYVYRGQAAPSCDLDVACLRGQIELVLPDRLPEREVSGQYRIESRLCLHIRVPRTARYLWDMGYPLPRRWPLLILTPSAGPSDPPTGGARYRRGLERTSVDEDPFYALSEWLLVGNDELERREDGQWVYRLPVLLPAGSVWLEAALWLDVIPADDFVGAFTELQRDIVRSGRARASMPQFTATRYAESVALNEQDRLWLAKGLGVLWLTKLAFGPALTGTEEEVVKKLQTLVRLPMVRSQTVSIRDVVDLSIPLEPYIFRTRSISVPVQDDQRSQVRVQWPEQPDQKVEELVATITDPAQWAKWVVCGATDPDRGSTLARALSGNKQAEPQWLGDFLTQVAAQAVHQSLAAGTNPFVNPVTLESLAAAPAEEAP